MEVRIIEIFANPIILNTNFNKIDKNILGFAFNQEFSLNLTLILVWVNDAEKKNLRLDS